MSDSERLTALCQEFCSGVTSQNVPKILAKGSIRAEVHACSFAYICIQRASLSACGCGDCMYFADIQDGVTDLLPIVEALG